MRLLMVDALFMRNENGGHHVMITCCNDEPKTG
jgi:hypothetical protein